MRKIILIICGLIISFSFNNRPKLQVPNNLIYASIIEYYQDKNIENFEKTISHLDPLFKYLKEFNKNLKSDLIKAFYDKNNIVFEEKLSNIIKADILNILNLIALAEIQCNESYDLNIGFSSYQIMSLYVKKRHGEELDKKIRKSFKQS